jgi:predicted aspartyl protease
VLLVRLAAPGAGPGVVFQALLDTGADCTLVPEAAAHALRLPAVDDVWIEGLGGASRRATVHAARIEFAGARGLARVVAFGDEGLLGRDLLNRVAALLDGPRLRLSVTGSRKR